jgi:hypothetical protein
LMLEVKVFEEAVENAEALEGMSNWVGGERFCRNVLGIRFGSAILKRVDVHILI